MSNPNPQIAKSPRSVRKKLPTRKAQGLALSSTPTAPKPRPTPKPKPTVSKKAPPPETSTSETSEGSSSQEERPAPSPLVPRFKSPAHGEFFQDEISKRPIVVERNFIISDADCFPLDAEGNKTRNDICIEVKEEIQWRKWTNLCNFKAPAYELLIKQFYTNMKIHENEDEYSTEVLGIPINFSPSTINSVCGTELEEGVECFYDKNKEKDLPIEEMNEVLCDGKAEWNINPPVPKKVRHLERTSLNQKAKMWCAFLIAILMPILHANTLTKRRLWCLFALMKKEPIDFGLLIAREMIEARNQKNLSLPYAKLISVLMHKNGINLRFYQTTPGKGDINTTYFKQYIFGTTTRRPKTLPASTSTSEPTPATISTEPSSSSLSREPSTHQFQRIENSLNGCKSDLAIIKAQLVKQDQKMDSLQADVKKCLMLLLGKPECYYVAPEPQHTPVVDATMIHEVESEPPEDELPPKDLQGTEQTQAFGSPIVQTEDEEIEEELLTQVENLVQKVVEESVITTPAPKKPHKTLDILVDASLSVETNVESKKRKRDDPKHTL